MINIIFLKNEFLNIKLSNHSTIVKLIYLFSILIPPLLVSGPFLPDLLLSIIGILFIIHAIKHGTKNLTKYTNLIYFFIICYVVLVVSALNSNFFFQSYKIIFYVRYFIYFFSIIYLLETFPNYEKTIFEIMKIIFYLLFIDSFVQFFLKKNILGIDPANILENSMLSISSFFGSEKILGSYLNRLFPFFLFLYFATKVKIQSNYLLIMSCILFIVTILTNERISMIYSIINILMLIFFINFNKKFKIIVILIFSIIPIVLFSLNINNIKHKVNTSLQEVYPGKLVFYSQTHENYAISSILIFKNNIVFGSGPKTFLPACINEGFSWKKNQCNNHPHNIFFQVIAETGLLGLSVYLYALFFFFKLFLNFLKNKSEKVFLIYSVFLFLNPIFLSGNLFNNWYNAISWIAIPFIFHNKNAD